MAFTSLNFIIFFPVITVLYWITPAKYRWVALLFTSYFFYINIKPIYVLLLAGVTLSTYIFTTKIDNTKDESRKKIFMVINIILILLPLLFFKYFAVINNGILSLLESNNLRWPLPEIKLILPIGISFYTFMAIGYTIDVYNEEIEAEKNLGIVAVFISFFPLILSGPIERARNLIPQFNESKKIKYNDVTQGLKLMLWGYFMKLVVADRLGIYIDAVFNNYIHHNGTSLGFASLLYPFQVYADLGGYSLIAIGTAKTIGINVMHNFKRPFFATSMSEFWRRWHISLISWLTDYIYTPLSFYYRRFKVSGIVLALYITFLISGIWHGASLNFILWGLIQGTFLSAEAFTKKFRLAIIERHNLNGHIFMFLSCIFTFLLFAFSQIFGRTSSINEATAIINKIATQSGQLYIANYSQIFYMLMGIFILMLNDFLDEFYPLRYKFFNSKVALVRIASYSLTIITIILFGVFDGGQFIYFQF